MRGGAAAVSCADRRMGTAAVLRPAGGAGADTGGRRAGLGWDILFMVKNEKKEADAPCLPYSSGLWFSGQDRTQGAV